MMRENGMHIVACHRRWLSLGGWSRTEYGALRSATNQKFVVVVQLRRTEDRNPPTRPASWTAAAHAAGKGQKKGRQGGRWQLISESAVVGDKESSLGVPRVSGQYPCFHVDASTVQEMLETRRLQRTTAVRDKFRSGVLPNEPNGVW